MNEENKDENKNKIIRQIDYDEELGFQSIGNTYLESKNRLNTITLEDVRKFMEKQKMRQLKGSRGSNSYVADEPLEECHVDLADFTNSYADNNGMRYCVVMLDIFTKYCVAKPIKTQQKEDVVNAMKELIREMGKSKALFSDNESSFNSPEFHRLLNENNSKHLISTSPSGFAERMIQTLKNMIHDRVEGLKLDKEKWVNVLPIVLKQYNNRKHSTTGVSPANAKRPEYQVMEKTYPNLSVGDTVKIKNKKKSAVDKSFRPWSDKTCKIAFKTKDNRYVLEKANVNRRLYLSHDLLKIEAEEDKDTKDE